MGGGTMRQPEKECPECKGTLTWKVIYGSWGKSEYNGLCSKCNIVLKGRETPDLRKGRLLAHELKINHPLDKRLTQYNGDVQIGYFREIQHCKTCGGPHYPQTEANSCKCSDCDCLYCREYKGEDK